MYSLQRRLGVGLFFSLVLLVVVQWWLVNGSVRDVAEDLIGTRLEHDADALLGALQFSGNGKAVLDRARVSGIYSLPYSGHYYRIEVNGQTLRSRSLWDEDLRLPTEFSVPLKIVGPQQQLLLVRRFEFERLGYPITILVAEELTAVQSDMEDFQTAYAMISLLVLVLIIFVQAWVVRHTLKPLETMRKDISALEIGELSQLSEAVPAEIKPVVTEFNHLLSVMQERLSRSRVALGNLAHALKTPLTVLTRLADHESLQAYPEIREQLKQQTAAILELMDRQLKRARLAGDSRLGWQFRVKDELQGLVDILGRIYAEKNLQIELNVVADKVFPGDREDLLELFGNLLDNACKWAEHRVAMTVKESEGLMFVIEDDGPGCTPEQCQQIMQRGVRLDESSVGHGLGLGIARDVVEQYGGTLNLRRSQKLGGFEVRGNLPRRSSR